MHPQNILYASSMGKGHSENGAGIATEPNLVRTLDATDRHIVRLLSQDGRMPNNAIAEAVGIAPSTCLGRIRSLQDRGIIRGFRADIDPAAIGLGVQVLIAVRLRASTRSHVGSFAREIAGLPGVMNVYFLGGADDFMLHVAASDTDGVRDFVAEHLSRRDDVANTVTHLIFEHVQTAVLT